MNTVTILLTKNPLSPISWLIRWALPRSRFALGLSSHCFIICDDGVPWETVPNRGVSRSSIAKLSKRNVVVKTLKFKVEDSSIANSFLRTQLGKGYDYMGALGIALAPSRDWSDDSSWFCYELAAAALRASGRTEFNSMHHIGETALIATADAVLG